MKNPIKAWRKKRQQKKQLKALQQTAQCFHSLDVMEEKGLLLWKPKERQLFIVSQLATVMMGNAMKWQNFTNNVFAWLYHREAEEAWEKFFLNEELKAVREAKENEKLKVKSEKSESPRVLSKAEVMAIRQARREEIMISDIKQPEVKPFQFFISHPKKDETDGSWTQELLAVGVYDEGQLEMVPWEEINI